MLNVELIIQVAFHVLSADFQFQIVPLPAWSWGVTSPFNLGALAVLVLEQYQIVLETIRAQYQVVPIRFDVEDDSCSLVDPARYTLEAQTDLTFSKIVDRFQDGDREVSVCGDVVEKLCIALTV